MVTLEQIYGTLRTYSKDILEDAFAGAIYGEWERRKEADGIESANEWFDHIIGLMDRWHLEDTV